MMRLLQLGMVLSILGWMLAGSVAKRLPPPEQIRPQLLAEPRQQATDRKPFRVEHGGSGYDVVPVAEYELYGLVVSHNDPHGFLDPYHDKNSFDTRDLCVIWGGNLRRDDYRRVQYFSQPWTCWMKWPAGVEFDATELGNNHLVTDRADLRRALDTARIGDQVHFRGWLVNYQDARQPGSWRRTSTTRTDTGNGACEVVFYDRFEVLVHHAPMAYALRSAFGWLALAFAAAIAWRMATVDPEPGELRR